MSALVTTIARHEWIASLRDGRLRASMLVMFALLAVAVLSGWHYQRALEAERITAAATEQARWLSQGSRNAHSAAHYGIYAFRPASALTSIDQGIDPFVGISVWLEAHHMDQFMHRPAQDGVALTRLGELTAALVLQVLMPLVIIMLTFGAFASEREQGTLRLLLSQGVPARALAAGKFLGVSATLSMLVVPAIALAAMAIMLCSPAQAAANGSRLLLLGLVYTLYLAGWVFLALAVSACAQARLALVILLGAWVLGCVALPRAAGDLVEWVYPVPAAAEFVEAMDRDLDERNASNRAIARRERILREHGVSRVEDLPIDWRGINLQEEEERNYPIFDAHYGALFDRYRLQSAGLQLAGLVAPLLSVQSLSEALTGTDIEHHRSFVFAAEAQRRVMQKLLNAEVTLRDREGQPDSLSGHELWSRVPPFRYEHPPLGQVLRHYWPAGIALALWVLLTSAAASVAIRRMQP